MRFQRNFLLTIIFLLVWSFQTLGYDIVKLGPSYFPESARNRPIANGEIYVGLPDLDPEVVANQQQLYVQEEDGDIIAVAQPIYTSAGGVPVYSGSPVTLLVNNDYSLKILNSLGTQVYYVPLVKSSENLGNAYTPDYNAADQGVTGDSNTVKYFVDLIGSTNKATVFSRHNSGNATTPYTFTTAETITANIVTEFEPGSYFAGTVTYSGSPDSQIKALPDQQIFSLTSTVTFGRSGTVYAAWWGFSTSASAANNKAAIDAAIASIPTGGIVQLPAGTFAIAPEIIPGKRNLDIRGVGTSYAYQDNTPGTKLVFTTGTYGFDLTNVDMTHQYCKISNLTIDGNDVLTYGIGIQGLHIIEEVMVKNCVTAGILFEDYVNSTHLNKVTCYSNTGYGLLIAGVSTTVFSVENSTFEANGVGIKQGSGLGYFNNLVIESNTGAGWEIYKIDDSLSLENHMNRIYFEDNNTGTTNYTMSTACEDATEHMTLYFTNSNVNQADGGSVKGIDLHGVWYSHFDNVSIGGGDTAHGIDIDTTSTYNLFSNYGTGNTIVDGGIENVLVKRKTATTVDSLGGLEYTGVLKATRFDSGSGVTASTASGAAVTLFDAATAGVYLVGVYIVGQGATVHASSTVISDGATVSLKNYETAGGAMAITVSGTNIQATQSSGNPQVISYRVIKL